MSRLVIVSNRVADLTKSAQSGGLAVGLADALRARGGVWFGWSGETEETAEAEPVVEKFGKVETIGLPLSEKDYSEYYLGYSNSVLWPLFHYRLDLVDYRPAFFKGYARVNRAFARALAEFLKPDDIIWVHDYHLILMAEYLRKLGVRNRIGFFLHIPFPPPDLLAASPNHKALVDGLFQYDLLGFQTHTDVGNLMRFAQEHAAVEVLDECRFSVKGRTVLARRFPIGIDVDVFRDMAAETPDDVRIDTARRKSLARKQIIGVDRLDYSKGLPDRMKAFARLLSQHPELEKNVTFLQVAPPTREEVDAYSDIRTELEVLTGSINGHFADFNWTPIRYIHRSVPRDKLAALFRASQVGFVTPLRDGMNLVAKEYVAAQDPEDPGVLILSQFAGAAEEMQDALIVNPYDIDEMARKLYEALTMPLAERRRRHAALYDNIAQYDAKAWLTDFIDTLEGRTGETGEPPKSASAA
jgi:trehalose 6-phosphate synthase